MFRREPSGLLGEDHGEQDQRDQLGGEGLGRGDADFRPGPGQETEVGGADQRRFRHVADAQAGAMAERLGVFQRREGVSRFARLRQRDDQRAGRHGRFAVAVFAGDFDAARQAGDAFDPVTGDQAGVVAGAAGQDGDAPHVAEQRLGICPEDLRHDRLGLADDFQRLGNGFRLLEDFLLHVVVISAALDRIGAQLGKVDRAFYRLAPGIGDAHAGLGDFGTVAIFEMDDAPGHLDQRGGVGGGEVLVFAQAEQQRCAVPGDDEQRRAGIADHGNGVGTDQLLHAAPDGSAQAVTGLQLGMNQMRDDFGIGLRGEDIAERLQLAADRLEILDDAVMHHRDAGRDVRMGIAFRGNAVRRPARMADADPPAQGLVRGQSFQFDDPADRAQALQPVADHGHPGRVVAAIFKPLQTIEQKGNDVALRYRADNAAHGGLIL